MEWDGRTHQPRRIDPGRRFRVIQFFIDNHILEWNRWHALLMPLQIPTPNQLRLTKVAPIHPLKGQTVQHY